MAEFQIYHNPRCTKSRQALKLLDEKGQDYEVILYLEDVPSFDQLKNVISQLGIKPYELLRRGEAIFKEKYKGKELSDDEWIQAMIEHPKLIERPIVIRNDRAIIGRPTERILEII